MAGPVDSNQNPLVTLVPPGVQSQPALIVYASGFSMTGLRITGVVRGGGILIRAGPTPLLPNGKERLRVADVTFERNVFDNAGTAIEPAFGLRFELTNGSMGASLERVRVRYNRFEHYAGSDVTMLLVAAFGENGVIQDVIVDGNFFADGVFGLEFGCNGTNNRASGFRVEHNTFARLAQGVIPINNNGRGQRLDDVLIVGNLMIDPISAGVGIGGVDCLDCVISNVRILRNVFRNSDFRGSAVDIRGGSVGRGGDLTTRCSVIRDTLIEGNRMYGGENPITILGGEEAATDCEVRNTTIVNNLVIAIPQRNVTATIDPMVLYPTASSAIYISGGRQQATNNIVDGVSIANNTLVSAAADGMLVETNSGSAVGNSVSGISLINTIMSVGLQDIRGEFDRSRITFCLFTRSDVAGAGNRIGEPRFVDPGQGDFRLRAGSPAIDAGMGLDAPPFDLEGRMRRDDPATPNTGSGDLPFVDIGAFEFQPPGTPRRRAVRH